MNTSIILNELIRDFGIELNIKEKRYPDKDEIKLRPSDFNPDKGFTIISQVRWLSLSTYLEFEDFSKDLLNSIMNNHQDKIAIMAKDLNMLVQNRFGNAIQTNINNHILKGFDDTIDLTRFKLSIHNPTMDKEKMTIEEYIIDHQKTLLGIILLLFDLEEYPGTETIEVEGIPEGSKTRIEVNKYERSRLNRQACLNYHGYSCKVCKFNFEEKYGELGKNFIHVHHIVPVSKMTENYLVDPINDLIPVCPNCHAMIHKRNPPFEIEELKKLMEKLM